MYVVIGRKDLITIHKHKYQSNNMCSLFVLIFSFHRAIIVFTLLSSLDSLKYGGPQVSRQNQIATTKQKATAKQKPRLNKKATVK